MPLNGNDKNKKIPVDNIEELVDSEGGVIDGDRNVSNDSEIETGPVQKPYSDNSDYEKGVSTTTDRAARYRQNIPWFAVYSYQGNSGRNLPVNETNKKVITKKQIEEEIMEDLVKKSKLDREVFDKNRDIKVDHVIDVINDVDFNEEQLNKLKKTILDKIMNNNA